MSKENQVRVRMAPSPTGNLHVGTAHTTLFNYLFARKHGGVFLMRIEDTDKERSKKEFENNILEGFSWLGITYDALYRQSERTELYRSYLKKALDGGQAFISREPKKDGEGEVEVVRLHNPGKKIIFEDIIRGPIAVDTGELGDFVIARSIDDPLYHFAVVVDDYDMGITHIIRAEDHISNTPRQILIQEALGIERPLYAHLPLILAPDRSKLSKRHGAVSISEYKTQGFLPEALVNYLVLLGWHPQDDREIFSLAQAVEMFDLTRVQKGGAIFDIQKLRSINEQYLHACSDDDFLTQARPYLPDSLLSLPLYSDETLRHIVPLLKERVHVLSDITALSESGDLDYFFSSPTIDTHALPWKQEGKEVAHEHLRKLGELIARVPRDNFTKDTVKSAVWEYVEEEGKGSVLWPLRYALSGKEKSPDPFTLAEIFGKEETLGRLTGAIHSVE